ncbi:hypothetical protein EJ08DRAFT_490140 [Tothia fuscella]|uniref:Uncharacterized protein n=1 Tax=Tothia fuscella TaxID=1048955 RepID=A0A9P4NI31_9PEZI|nr:hypothetical protein EJ08DRAFT_490140 [Tothia fuscella]
MPTCDLPVLGQVNLRNRALAARRFTATLPSPFSHSIFVAITSFLTLLPSTFTLSYTIRDLAVVVLHLSTSPPHSLQTQ